MRYSLKSFSKARIYGHAVGRIMVHESTMLGPQHVRRLVESDFHEALSVISETVFGPYLAGASTSQDVEAGLIRMLADEYEFMDRICAQTRVAEFMHLKYDFHNLKVLLKKKYAGVEIGELLSRMGKTEVRDIEEALERNDMSKIPSYLRVVIEKVASRGDKIDPQWLGSVVDRAFLEMRLQIAVEEGSKLLVSYCKAAIDVANLLIMLRGANLGKGEDFFREALAEGGGLSRDRLLRYADDPFSVINDELLKSAYGRLLSEAALIGDGRVRLTSLDKASDDFLLDKMSGFQMVSVGPERILKYMLRREDEVAVIRAILIGKLYQLTPETIEQRLPEHYTREAVR